MRRFQLHYQSAGVTNHAPDQIDVPDIGTALVVADILDADGKIEIRDGEALVARFERRDNSGAPFWQVG